VLQENTLGVVQEEGFFLKDVHSSSEVLPQGAVKTIIPVAVSTLVFVLFFLSGASSLVYQVVWVRLFTQVFGSTTFAVSTVLTAFMAGLALGSYLFGRLADRHEKSSLLLYGILEGAIGIYALIVPLLISIMESTYIWIYRVYEPSSSIFIFMRFIICLVILLAPTTMMGATLPLISRFIVKHTQTLGQRVGILYGINTAGAVAGCYLAGFVLIGSLGLRRTTLLAVGANALIMVAAFALGSYFWRRTTEAAPQVDSSLPSEDEIPEAEDRSKARRILFCFALAGFASLCYEVLWTRTLIFFMGYSTYAFTSMLTTFLLGLALGSFLFARIADRSKDRFLLFCKIEVVIALWAVISIPLFNEAFYMLQERWGRFIMIDLSWEYTAGLKFLKAFIVMIIPTTMMGAAFPVVCRIFSSDLRHVGRNVAAVYSVNTLGAIIGSAAAGLVIIPLFGTQQGIMVVAAINFGIAIWALFMSHATARKRAAMLAAVVGAAAVTMFVLPRNVVLRIPTEMWEELLFYKEDSMALVKVYKNLTGSKNISVDGNPVAGTSMLMQSNQKMLAHLPMLLHEDPRTVLVVGFGAGGAAYSMTLHEPDRVDCVELVPSVIEAAPYLDEANHDVLSSPIFHVTIDDGRTFLLASDKKYDVVSIDVIDPKHLGASNLYTVESYRLCKEHLNPGGVMVAWLPYDLLTPEETSAILASHTSVFEYTTLWFNPHFTYLLLVGADHEFEIDYQRLDSRIKSGKVAEDLNEIFLFDAADFLHCFAADADTSREIASRAHNMNTYDTPVIEFYQFEEGDRLAVLPVTKREGFPNIKNFGANPQEEEENERHLRRRLDVADRIIRALQFDRRFEKVRRWQHFRAASALDPSDTIAQRLAITEKWKINEQLNRQISIAREDRSLTAYGNVAGIYYEMGELSTAASVMEEAVRFFPDSIEARLNLADYYERMGKHKEASEQRQSASAAMRYGPRP
jgi:spermidine synthase